MPKPGAYGTYLGNGRVLVATTWGGVLLASADDLSLTPELAARGIYEPAFTRYLMRTLRPGYKAVDVGANIGVFTVLMAGWVGPSGHVMAYEPNPDVLPFLRDNVALNWFNDRVTIREAAASDADAKVAFYVTERFQGNSSMLEPGDAYFAHTPTDSVREIEVDVESLDIGARELGHIDLVKIDVEGAEYRVLSGMARLLDEERVDRVTFEVYRERAGDGWGAFCEVLRGLAGRGWRFHEVNEDGTLRMLDVEVLFDVGRYTQVVMCCPTLSG
jgi:FkbM family methyltransferase